MATLRGSQRDDVLRGNGEDDRLFGLAGDDALFGGGGADQVRGGAGRDLINGGAGADQLAGGGGADRLSGGPGLDVMTGGAGADRFLYRAAGDGTDRITDFDRDQGDEVQLAGGLIGAALRMVDDGTSTTVQVRTADADRFTDLAVLEGHREPIDVWYGDQQQFGDPGEAQRWVNILGTVATEGLATLSYSLNGGPEQALNFGPNGNRLEDAGDFNVELDYAELNPGGTDDLVEIRAAYANGDVFTRDVAIDYEGGEAWPTSYEIDWAEVTDLQEVVQVVDGHWAFDEGGVRPAVIGYDRVLNFGDAAWDNYEVRFSFTPHDLSQVDIGGAIWFGLQWGGHTDDPFGGSPHGGYVPGTTFMLNGPGVRLRPSEFFPDADGDGVILNPAVNRAFAIAEEHTYNVLIRNEHVATDQDLSDGLDRIYSIRLWEAGTPELEGFLIQQTMVDQEPFGSFYLNAHYVDVTFGDVTVRALSGDDLLASEDALPGLPAAAAAPVASAASTASISAAGGSGGIPALSPSLSDLVVGADQTAAA